MMIVQHATRLRAEARDGSRPSWVVVRVSLAVAFAKHVRRAAGQARTS